MTLEQIENKTIKHSLPMDVTEFHSNTKFGLSEKILVNTQNFKKLVFFCQPI